MKLLMGLAAVSAFAAFLLGLIAAPGVEGQSNNEGFEFPASAEDLLDAPLDRSFTCDGLQTGFYADVANNCQVFHYCWEVPVSAAGEDPRTFHWSFICPNQTLFDQANLVCNHIGNAFPCEEAESLYGAVEFGNKLEEEDEEREDRDYY